MKTKQIRRGEGKVSAIFMDCFVQARKGITYLCFP